MTQPLLHRTQAAAPAIAQVRSAADRAGPWVSGLGRLGLACKGAVYLLIGILALQAALGLGGETTDPQGVLTRILETPIGKPLLGVVAAGLIGYVVWRLVQAVLDTEAKGTGPRGLWARGGYVVSAIIHTFLAVSALGLLRGLGGGEGGDQSVQDRTAQLMAQPFGPALVALVGFGLLAAAAFQLYRAYSADFNEKLRLGELSPKKQQFAVRTGRLGHAARGVTFGIMGLFLLVAALRQEPGEARGLAGSLGTLAQQPYGPLLLGVVAAGLGAYGLYMFVEARYRRMVV